MRPRRSARRPRPRRTAVRDRAPRPRARSSRPASRIGAADQQRALEPALDQRDALEAVVERALEQEQLGAHAAPRGRGASRAASCRTGSGHGRRLCDARGAGDKSGHGRRRALRTAACAGRSISRCRRAAPAAAPSSPTSTASAPIAGGRSNSSAIRGCSTCGLPLQATEADELRRVPGAAAADRADPRGGRLRRSVARPRHPPQIRPQGRDRADHGALHGAARRGRTASRCWSRCRCTARGLWTRGFNQSALVARELSRRLGIAADPLAHAPDAGARRRSRA